jgi:hypothetical protein
MVNWLMVKEMGMKRAGSRERKARNMKHEI